MHFWYLFAVLLCRVAGISRYLYGDHGDGIPDGIERHYSEEGEITEERVYKDGKLIKETK